MKKLTTPLMIVTACLWGATTIMGWLGLGFEALFPALLLLFLYAVLGSAKGGRLSTGYIIYPLVAWLAVWAASFILSEHHARMYEGRLPELTILGLHPSFAWTVLLYWVGGVLTLTVGFYIKRDDWLSKADWEAFKENIAEPDEGGGS